MIVEVELKRRWRNFNAGETVGVDEYMVERLRAEGFLGGENTTEAPLADPMLEVHGESRDENDRRRKRWHRDRMSSGGVQK